MTIKELKRNGIEPVLFHNLVIADFKDNVVIYIFDDNEFNVDLLTRGQKEYIFLTPIFIFHRDELHSVLAGIKYFHLLPADYPPFSEFEDLEEYLNGLSEK